MQVSNPALKQKELIYDVGMHKGEDTDYYLKKGFKVIGFEADPDLLRHCRNRFLKEIESGNLAIVEGAIVDTSFIEVTEGKVKFYKNRDNTVWGTASVDWASRNEGLDTHNEIIEVNAVDFTECLIKYGIPYYLKIDIEGLDAVCLRALLNFEERPSYVSIESEKVEFAKLLEELFLLDQLGYTEFKAVQQMDIYSQVEPNPPGEGSYLGYRFQNGASGLFGKDLPGKWKNMNQIIKKYKNIFRLYSLFGDYGSMKKSRVIGLILKIISKISKRSLPGWYDTHAKHLSVV